MKQKAWSAFTIGVSILLAGCVRDGGRQPITDCQTAATRLAAEHPGWRIEEVHSSDENHKCYLSYEMSEYGPSQDRVRDTAMIDEVVLEVGESRDVLRCSSTTWTGGTDSWLCRGPRGESISRERFLELRAKLLRE